MSVKTGNSIACLLDMNRKSQFCTLNLWAGDIPTVGAPSCPTRQRLAQSFSRLQNIQLVRNHRQDPHFEQSVEERIVWRELLDLELQDVDEQIERISAASGAWPPG